MRTVCMLLFAWMVQCLPAKIFESRPLSVSIEGCTDSYDTWGVIPCIEYKPIRFASISGGLRISDFWSKTERPYAVDAGGYLYEIEDQSDFIYHFAFQPELKLYAPTITISKSEEIDFFFFLGIGAIVPLSKQARGYVYHIRKDANATEVERREYIKNTTKPSNIYRFTDMTCGIKSDRWSIGLGYRKTNYDIFGGARHVSVEGTKVHFPEKSPNKEVYILISYNL